jgi:hypothetical protein
MLLLAASILIVVADALSPRAIEIRDRILNGDLSGWQLFLELKSVKDLLPDERTLLWEEIKSRLSEQNYNDLHELYVKVSLGHAWGRL